MRIAFDRSRPIPNSRDHSTVTPAAQGDCTVTIGSRSSRPWQCPRWTWQAGWRRGYASCGGSCRTARLLDRRARYITVRAIDAAVACLRFHLAPAALANVDVLAGIRGHGLGGSVPAGRARDRGSPDQFLFAHAWQSSARLHMMPARSMPFRIQSDPLPALTLNGLTASFVTG
jgi:hypothetical protein